MCTNSLKKCFRKLIDCERKGIYKTIFKHYIFKKSFVILSKSTYAKLQLMFIFFSYKSNRDQCQIICLHEKFCGQCSWQRTREKMENREIPENRPREKRKHLFRIDNCVIMELRNLSYTCRLLNRYLNIG